jgi:hypothetical protein
MNKVAPLAVIGNIDSGLTVRIINELRKVEAKLNSVSDWNHE